MTSFLFIDNIEKIQEKFEYFENIMENGAFAPKYYGKWSICSQILW